MLDVVFAGPMPTAGSFHISGNQFSEWTKEDHGDAYRKLMGASKNHAQFLIHGRVRTGEDFKWTFIPYEKCTWAAGRIMQQMQVMYALTFGGGCRTVTLSPPEVNVFPADEASKSDDAFCNDDVIERQLVCPGTRVNLLFNHAPIRDADFLIVPKNHRPRFQDLTQEEYVEAIEMAQRVATIYSEKTIYIHCATGKDAGQTVKHWHMHVIVTDTVKDELSGRLHLLYKMVMPVTPLKPEALAERMAKLPQALKGIEDEAV